MYSIRTLIFSVLCISHAYAGIHTVTNTNDAGPGSLRQAIIDANADPGPTRTINFSIGSGVQTIIPLSNLPAITVPNTTVDGSTQPGWSANNPVIVINGAALPAPVGFAGVLTILNVSNCTVRDLVINGGDGEVRAGILISNDGSAPANNNAVYGCFLGIDQTGTVAVPNGAGIVISGSSSVSNFGNIVGGSQAVQRNVISGNSQAGLGIITNSHQTVVHGNYIGTNKTATAAVGNLNFGIIIFGTFTPALTETCTGTIIGGTGPGQRNIISGNSSGAPDNPFFGIVFGPNCLESVVYNNFMGTDVSGTIPIPNEIAVGGFGTDPASPDGNGAVLRNIVGGPGADQGNVLSGNIFAGAFFFQDTHDNVVQGNFIGTDKTATLNLANGISGVRIQGGATSPSTNNLIGGTNTTDRNIIVFNGPLAPGEAWGVLVDGDNGNPTILNPILGNPIFNNFNNGIELRNNGNHDQEPPTINLACLAGNILTVTITAPATPAASNFRLEIFVNSVNRNPITEGERFAGAIVSVPSGATVTESFLIANVTPGMWVSATATNLNNIGGTPGDTSPFTLNTIILAAPTVTVTAFPATILPTQSSTITATISGVPPFDLVWSDGFTQLGVTSPVTRVVSPLVTTTYSVTVTASTGCQTTGSVTVFVAGLSPITKAILNKYCGIRVS